MNNEYQSPYHTPPEQQTHTYYDDLEPKKKHSILGIISIIVVGVMLIGSIIALSIFVSAINDYKYLAEVTPYNYDELTDYINAEFANPEHSQMFESADMKFGLAFLLCIALGAGYLVALVLGIIGLTQRGTRKLFSVLGTVFSVVLPSLFFLITFIYFLAPLF